LGKHRIEFLRESLRNLRLTGSVSPSSRFLCRAVANKIDPAKAKTVVELGPGNGVITRFILDRLSPQSRLIIFEINPVFVAKIRATFDDPRMTIIHDSAENMGQHFQALGISEVDYFISGIPFVMLPESLTESITQACRSWLREGGRFIQFHYSPLLLRLYRRAFGNISVDIVALNIPPAIVISCEKRPFKKV
jgi:phosphatidylethanolamine/phosphatidyl-N-methylethanolamine N-methyltransferase